MEQDLKAIINLLDKVITLSHNKRSKEWRGEARKYSTELKKHLTE